MLKFFIPLIILGIHVISPASAMSWMGTVFITQVNNKPCFHVKGADNEGKKFQLQSIHVTESVKVPWYQQSPIVWSITTTQNQLAVVWPATRCMSYGVLPKGFSEEHPPLKLEPWKIYGVSVSTTRDGEEDLSSGVSHTGKFCIYPTANGALVVHAIERGEAAQRLAAEVCSPKTPSK